jgi:jumonji domain-containing protein 7
MASCSSSKPCDERVLRRLKRNGSLWASDIPVIDCPSPEYFFREYVAPNRPVVIRGLLGNCNAANHWSDRSYLSAQVGNKRVSVNYTPHGWGDCSVETHDGQTYFVQPLQKTKRFDEFLDDIFCPRELESCGVPYLSQQNDSLRQELPELLPDLERSHILEFASSVFQQPLDAVNLWIGDERSVSSTHKDPYENLYTVVSGTKTFSLLPPCEILRLDERRLPPGEWVRMQGPQSDHDVIPYNDSWGIRLFSSADAVPWICRDIRKDFHDLNLLHVEVKAGETLYLPALWYHQVSQTEFTIAVNVWHDMAFDCKWVYFQLLRDLMSLDQCDSDSEFES